MKQAILLVVSHVCVLAAGFALGVYALPILTAPTAPTLAETSLAASQSIYKGNFGENAHMRHNEKDCLIESQIEDAQPQLYGRLCRITVVGRLHPICEAFIQ